MSEMFIGLDLETSGLNIYAGAVPIQIGLGVVLDNGDQFMNSDLVGGWRWTNLDEDYLPEKVYDESVRAYWDFNSAKIHNIDPRALKRAENASEVTLREIQWMNDRELPNAAHLHIVGWNVSTFDMPFISRYMPALEARLSYRVVELNSLAFALTGKEQYPGGPPMRYDGVKRRAREYAETMLEDAFPEPQWHDAGYDALAAVHAYNYLKGAIAV